MLRSVDPPLSEASGKRVVGVRRIGKRIVLALDDDLFLIVHLMIAGRLRWRPRKGGQAVKVPRRRKDDWPTTVEGWENLVGP